MREGDSVEARRGAVGEATEILVGALVERLGPLLAREVAREVAAALAEAAREPPGETAASREVMNARDAAEFLGLSRAAFGRLAPNLPRSRVSQNRFVYLRVHLLEWLEQKTEAPADWHRARRADPETGRGTKRGPRKRRDRLV